MKFKPELVSLVVCWIVLGPFSLPVLEPICTFYNNQNKLSGPYSMGFLINICQISTQQELVYDPQRLGMHAPQMRIFVLPCFCSQKA
jgi:hypothetical protein